MNIWDLRPGDRVRTRDGAVVEVLDETEDGEWILISYMYDPENPSVEGTEDLIEADELVSVVASGPY